MYNDICNCNTTIYREGESVMKKLQNKKWLYLAGNVLTSFALMITTLNVNTTCYWVLHQDELPQTAKKLRKF